MALTMAVPASIQVPGKFTLQRLGRRSSERNPPGDSTRSMNVFSGRSSRVLRVLLEKPKCGLSPKLAKNWRHNRNESNACFASP